MRRIGLKHLIRRRQDEERGSVILMAAVGMVAMLGFLGLVLDYGHSAQQHRQAQNAADGAALAAAYSLWNGSTESAAQTVAQSVTQKDGFTSAELSTLYFYDTNGNQTATATNVRSVHAVVTHTFPTLLLGLIGVNTSTVSGTAEAKLKVPGDTCVLCVLDPTASGALNLSQSGSVNVTGGPVVVDSSSSTGLISSQNGTITAPSIGVVGGYSQNKSGEFSPTPTTIASVPDPLASVPTPTCGTNQGSVNNNGSTTMTLSPGTYGNINIQASGGIVLSPGTYCITGKIAANGTGSFTGNGVMMYFTCGSSSSPTACASTGQAGGYFALNQSGTYTVSPPTSGTYQGISIFYDRNNTSPVTLAQSGSDSVAGTVYAAKATLSISQSGGVYPLDSQIVVDKLSLSQTGPLNISYTAAENYLGSPPVLSE